MQDRIEDPLLIALRDVARDGLDVGASPSVERRLRAEVRAIARARRVSALKVCAAAAVLAIAVAVPAWRVAQNEPMPTTPQAEITTEFMPLRYSTVPLSNGHVVRMEVPDTALASFGFAPMPSGQPVLADVLVGEDGLARAVRFVVHPAEGNSEETLR